MNQRRRWTHRISVGLAFIGLGAVGYLSLQRRSMPSPPPPKTLGIIAETHQSMRESRSYGCANCVRLPMSTGKATPEYSHDGREESSPNPTFSIPSGGYQADPAVTIADSTPGTKIYYTTNPTPGADQSLLTYPNIEAPDTVYIGQEIAVQISLSDQQLAPETKIVSGDRQNGKLKLKMASGEEQWNLTVNVSAPGLELTRGTNTLQITVGRDGNSDIAAFYMRPKPAADGKPPAALETQILATLFHNNSFVARLLRPVTIMPEGRSPDQTSSRTSLAPAVPPASAAHNMGQALRTDNRASAFDLSAAAPTMTVVENRVHNLLRIDLFSPEGELQQDIDDAAALHDWIDAHFARIASYGRGLKSEQNDASLQSGKDYLDSFGNELYDKVVPQELKAVFYEKLARNQLHSIQVFSDDPAVPWELMRVLDPKTQRRSLPLGELVSIARWPLKSKGLVRPKQSIVASRSFVVAPRYTGEMALPQTAREVESLLRTPTFRKAEGDYRSVRALAANPPPGFVHFAGHGMTSMDNGIGQYSIILEDGAIGPEAWKALNSSNASTGTLYFFNACDVGQSHQFMNEVDGWAPALLDGGASGYIGALWPISDSTATAFATEFYKQLRLDLNSEKRSAAVSQVLTATRMHVFEQTKDPTALAYVFYGDPQLRVTAKAE